MTQILRSVPFVLEMLTAVEGFVCGDEPWEKEVSDWINGRPMERGLRESIGEGIRFGSI